MTKEILNKEIVIIGGGPGGYVAAIKAAQMGADVALVEKDSIGGVCLNRGCIPTKALVRSAEVYDNINDAKSFGLEVDDSAVSVNMKKVIRRKDRVTSRLVKGVEHLLKSHKVDIIDGIGEFIDENTILVKSEDGEEKIKGENIIIATGSKASTIPIEGIELKGVIDSNQALELDELPEELVIVGGGYIGMEFAFIFANFGVEVTVIEFMDEIIAGCGDEDICKEIHRSARRKGINILTNSRVEAIKENKDKLEVEYTKDDKKISVDADKVLMSVGREPFYEGLNIENAGIELDENDRGIKVNEKMETNIPHIYAIGDVTDEIQLAHVASHQGTVAVKNILGEKATMNYDVVPSAIFTNPEIANVGLSKKDAEEKGIEVEVGYFPYRANGKALAQGERDGFIKLIENKENGKLIGANIVGTHASDLLGEVTLAIENDLRAEDIAETIHAHPTTAEVIHEAALDLAEESIHFA
ncbi:MAG: dihydrolipoyl dehydrogenase [Bacillota bacterium]